MSTVDQSTVTEPTLTCIAPAFPTPWIPENGAFMKSIADVMCDEGVDVQVVAPISLARQMRERSRKEARRASPTPRERPAAPCAVAVGRRAEVTVTRP